MTPKFLFRDSGRTADFCSRYGHRRRRVKTRRGSRLSGKTMGMVCGVSSQLSRGDKVEMSRGNRIGAWRPR